MPPTADTATIHHHPGTDRHRPLSPQPHERPQRDAVFLVFEYCEHDMASLIDTMGKRFSESEVWTRPPSAARRRPPPPTAAADCRRRSPSPY